MGKKKTREKREDRTNINRHKSSRNLLRFMRNRAAITCSARRAIMPQGNILQSFLGAGILRRFQPSGRRCQIMLEKLIGSDNIRATHLARTLLDEVTVSI